MIVARVAVVVVMIMSIVGVMVVAVVGIMVMAVVVMVFVSMVVVAASHSSSVRLKRKLCPRYSTKYSVHEFLCSQPSGFHPEENRQQFVDDCNRTEIGPKNTNSHLNGGHSPNQRIKLVAVRVVLVIVTLVGIMYVIRLIPMMFVLVALVLIVVVRSACHRNLPFKAVLPLTSSLLRPQNECMASLS